MTNAPRTGSTSTEGVGQVIALHVSPARGIGMRPIDEAHIATGHGITGDRYCNSRHRHVTVQSAEDLVAAAQDLGAPIAWDATRRNITTTGVAIPTRPGDRLSIGDVQFEVVRIAAPCKLLDDWIVPGARTAMRRRGGSVLRVLSGGTIRLGDEVTVAVSERS